MRRISAGALDNLEHGSLQLAAVAARALFEIAATSSDVHTAPISTWREVHGSADGVRNIVRRPDGDLWQALWKARVGTRRGSLAEGWPAAINVQTRLTHLGRGDEDFSRTVKQVYGWLCEAYAPKCRGPSRSLAP